jgi:hypothetical protein
MDFYQQKALYIRMESRMDWGAEGCKRLERESLMVSQVSHGAQSMYFTVFVAISDILQIFMWM